MKIPRRVLLPLVVLVGIAAGLALLVGLGLGTGTIAGVDAPFAVLVALVVVALSSIPLIVAEADG